MTKRLFTVQTVCGEYNGSFHLFFGGALCLHHTNSGPAACGRAFIVFHLTARKCFSLTFLRGSNPIESERYKRKADKCNRNENTIERALTQSSHTCGTISIGDVHMIDPIRRLNISGETVCANQTKLFPFFCMYMLICLA